MIEQDTTEAGWERVCILCASSPRPRKTPLDAGHCCAGCVQHLRLQLQAIVQLTLDAFMQLEPGKTGQTGSHAYGSRPPLNVDALDPELAPIELNRGDATSAVPILEMLEMWERIVREERHLTPYGIASDARCALHRRGHNDTGATLTGVVSFLTAHLDWITTTADFPLEDFADHVRRAFIALRRWDTTRQSGGTRIPCPTLTEYGECRYPLVIRGTSEVDCKRCGRTWPVDRLILVAGQDVDAWVDAEALAHIAGVTERTIRNWSAAGKVARKGQLYRLQDVKNHAEQLGA